MGSRPATTAPVGALERVMESFLATLAEDAHALGALMRDETLAVLGKKCHDGKDAFILLAARGRWGRGGSKVRALVRPPRKSKS
jgi:hypothetical protein